ncbi:hypothetical protein TNCV_383171 [Trichonephila clavipes]|nr:hypothetical protein TNCV_383171 [Trichonephila clavipes]
MLQSRREKQVWIEDGSTICDNYSRSSMPEDNFFKLLSICFHEQTLEISQGDQFQCDGKGAIAGGWELNVRWSLRNGLFSPLALPTMHDIPNDISVHSRPVKSLAYPVISFRETKVSCGGGVMKVP